MATHREWSVSETKEPAVFSGRAVCVVSPKLEDRRRRIGRREAMGRGGGNKNFGAQNFGDEAVWVMTRFKVQPLI